MTRCNRRAVFVAAATTAVLAFTAAGTAAADPQPTDRATISSAPVAGGGACCYQ